VRWIHAPPVFLLCRAAPPPLPPPSTLCPPCPSRRLALAVGRWPAASSREEGPRAVGVPGAVTRSRGIGLAAAAESVEEEADAGSSSCCRGEACRGRSRRSRRARLGRGHCRPSITSTIHLGASTVGCLDFGATHGRTQREAMKICSLCSSRLEIVPNSIHR
jgi:hypothetical protein